MLPCLGPSACAGEGVRNDASPSLDKIIPSLGYVPGNVLVISWRANRIKCDATANELMLIANYYKGV